VIKLEKQHKKSPRFLGGFLFFSIFRSASNTWNGSQAKCANVLFARLDQPSSVGRD